MGIDPAYGSSAFGIVVTQWADGIIQIMHAEEYHRPDYDEMLSLVYSLMSKYDVDSVMFTTTMIVNNLQSCSNYILINLMDKLVSSSTPTVDVNAIMRRSQARVWKTLKGEPEFIISVADAQNILGKA